MMLSKASTEVRGRSVLSSIEIHTGDIKVPNLYRPFPMGKTYPILNISNKKDACSVDRSIR